MTIYPAILTESVPDLQQSVDRLAPITEEVLAIQVDVIDGEYADNLTISPIDLIGVKFYEIPVDFHLMVNDPINYVYECKQVEGARGVIAQIERMSSQKEFIQEVLEFNLLPGLSLDLYTPIESIERESWEKIRFVQVMGNRAGFSGQAFKGEQVLHKIKKIAAMKKKLDLPSLEIVVDIGMNPETIPSVTDNGATGVAVTSALWNSEDIVSRFHELISITEV